MYCPVCKAQYRAGSSECADCHVVLVTELPKEGTPRAYAVLWKGENVDFGTKLMEQLEAVQIPSVTVPVDLLFRNSRDFFDVAERPLFGSAVCVTRENYSAARRIAEKLIEEEPGEDQAGLTESVEMAGIPAPVPELPLEWDPASATIELWRGAESGSLRFVADALHGVGIPTRQDRDEGGMWILWVRAEDEQRGHEIVSEVLEGKPPE
jgi:hypothetical protein